MRAPCLGAFLVGVGLIVATFIVDEILTGAPLFELSKSSTRGHIVTAIAAVTACFSLVMFLAWREEAGFSMAFSAALRPGGAAAGGRRDAPRRGAATYGEM